MWNQSARCQDLSLVGVLRQRSRVLGPGIAVGLVSECEAGVGVRLSAQGPVQGNVQSSAELAGDLASAAARMGGQPVGVAGLEGVALLHGLGDDVGAAVVGVIEPSQVGRGDDHIVQFVVGDAPEQQV